MYFSAKTLYRLITILFIAPLTLSAQTSYPQGPWHPAYTGKEFIRSEWFAAARADQHGSLKAYTRAMQEHLLKSAERDNPDNHRYAQWVPLGPSTTTHPVSAYLGLVSAIWVDTSDFKTIYAGSNTGGIFRTRDGGENWQPLSHNTFTTGVLSIHVDPRNKDRIIIGTGHYGFNRSYGMGVMISNDGGNTWEQTSLDNDIISASFVVQKTGMHPASPDTMLALLNTEFSGRGYIYRTTDGTASWEEVYSKHKAELFSLNYKPGEPNTVYACGNHLLKSTDAGATWSDITQILPLDTNFVLSRVAISLSAQTPGLMLAFCDAYDSTGTNGGTRKYLLRSFDEGATFETLKMKVDPFAGYWKMQFAISPADNEEFYLGGVWLFKYRIEGDSAKYIECSDHKYHIDVRDLHVYATGEKDLLYMANDGGVSLSNTGAESWQDITRNGMQILQLHNITIGENSDMMFGGPQDANLSFYNFKTGEWSRNARISDAYDGAINFNDPNIVYLVGVPPKYTQPHIFLKKSTDGGLNFTTLGIPDSTEAGRWDKPLEMDPLNPEILYLGVRNVWKTTDGANSFTRISDFPAEGDPKLITIRVAPSNNSVIYAAFQNPDWGDASQPKLFVTPDGGNRWFDITPRGQLNLNYTGISDVAVHPGNPQKIWLSLDRMWQNRHVYVSEDAGATWTNFSEGLPNLPVNTIKYVKGAGYDILLAATDNGVYYRDANLAQWVPFGEGLPLTIVADLAISYSRKKIIAGTFGRGLWETDLCLPVTESALIISDSIKWDNDRKMLQDVIVNPGAKLTISRRVEMGRGRTIKVMPGGTLNIDGGMLINDCTDRWAGIRLYGDPDYSSPSGQQATLNIRYGGSVRNAITGVETFGMDEQGNPVPGAGGGRIFSTNALFVNNLKAVVFNPASGTNPSVFRLSKFITDAMPTEGSSPGDMVTVLGNEGITFSSCQFENNIQVTVLPYWKRGAGIRSFNSSLQVNRHSTDSIPFGLNADPVFKQLSTGISSINTLPGHFINISKTRFDRNLTGIYTAGAGLFSVTGSYFIMGSTNVPYAIKPLSAGLYLDHCNLFRISDNTFTGPVGSIMPQSKSAGIVVHESGIHNNMIISNSIRNLNYGILAQNQNLNSKGNSGLRVLNNWFTGNEYDFCVTHDSLSSHNGIARHQGASGREGAEVAGNRFSYSRFHRDGDIHNAGKRLYYHYPPGPEGLNRQPRITSYGVYAVPDLTAITTDSSYKPEFLRDATPDLQDAFAKWSERADIARELIESLTDEGDSFSLINEIRHHTGFDAPALYSKLKRISPYLSDEAIIALTLNGNFPSNLLTDILKRNPHFFRIPGILQKLEQRKPEIQPYLYAPLAEVYNIYSAYEQLSSSADYLRAARDEIFSGITAGLSESANVSGNQDSLMHFLISDDRPVSMMMAASLAQNKGNHSDALEISDQLALRFPETEPEQSEDFKTLLRLNQQYFYPGYWTDLPASGDSTAIVQLLNGPAGIHALNMLRFFGMVDYNEPYILPGEPVADTIPGLPAVVIKGNGFRIFPVPAGDFVVLDYFTERNFRKCQLRIYTSTGSLAMEINLREPYSQILINTSGLRSGLYLFKLLADDETIASQKVVIAR